MIVHDSGLLQAKIGQGIAKHTALLVVSGVALLTILVVYLEVIRPVMRNETHAQLRQVASPVETISLDLKFKEYEKLKYFRQKALAAGYIVPEAKQELQGKFSAEGVSSKASVRLKGDLLDHVEGEKWSLRIKLKSDTFHGMKEFSIQTPETRNFLYQFLFFNALKQEGLPTLRSDFVTLRLNGTEKGVYTYEEHFTKLMLENNQLREAPIFRFDESVWWAARRRYSSIFQREDFPGAGDFYSLQLSAFQQKKLVDSPRLRSQFQEGYSLIEGLRNGELQASQVFDVKKLATTLAMVDLFGAHHALSVNQLRFYLNPITSKIELLMFDASAGEPIKTISGGYRKSDARRWSGGDRALFWELVFKDPIIVQQYVKELERISQKAWLDTFVSSVEEELANRVQVVQIEHPHYHFTWKRILENQKTIREFLDPKIALHAFLSVEPTRDVVLEVGNLHGMMIELLYLEINGDRVPLESTPFLAPRSNMAAIEYQRYVFGPERIAERIMIHDEAMSKVNLDQSATIRLAYTLPGSSVVRFQRVVPHARFEESLVTNNPLRENEANIASSQELVLADAEAKILKFTRPEMILTETVVIPKDYTLEIEPGSTIDLRADVNIVSYGAIDAEGTASAPITIMSSDRRGFGLVIIGATKGSLFRNVRFSGISAPRLKTSSWELSGAITLYETSARFVDCIFSDNVLGDDYLNAVRSKVNISNSVFTGVAADALDVDFGTAVLKHVTFTSTGNDGVDVSGSTATLSDVRFSDIGDKAVSVGEKSVVELHRIVVENAEIGIAAKDSSRVAGDVVTLRRVGIGVTAFQKKPEFGPAQITITGVDHEAVKQEVLLESGSKITIDGQEYSADAQGLRGVLYE